MGMGRPLYKGSSQKGAILLHFDRFWSLRPIKVARLPAYLKGW